MGCIALVRCVLVLLCGLAVVVWYPYAGFSLHTDTTPPQPNHNVTPTHFEPEQYNPWNNSTNKSQAREDGCIKIRNMLSVKYWNNKASDIKLVSLYSTPFIRFWQIRISTALPLPTDSHTAHALCWQQEFILCKGNRNKLHNTKLFLSTYLQQTAGSKAI